MNEIDDGDLRAFFSNSHDEIKKLLEASEAQNKELKKELVVAQDRVYSQLESLSWLQRRMVIPEQLPALRGWAASPDVLLHIHTYIMTAQPETIVEFGSGASTLVIADALSQNGKGSLISIEHNEFYAEKTLSSLQAQGLASWVDLRVGALELWDGEHLNPQSTVKPSRWYPVSLLKDVENVDLLWIDGPPGGTCPFSRYPALPAMFNKLAVGSEVWIDDTIRQEEQETCKKWCEDYGLSVEYHPFEKGLGRLFLGG